MSTSIDLVCSLPRCLHRNRTHIITRSASLDCNTRPLIDGDLSEWKRNAFNDGLWDIARLAHAPWYDPKINRLTDHGNEPALEDDLAARYYIAWDSQYLYLGAEVTNNSNDVSRPRARTQALVLQRRNLLVYRSAAHTASQKVRRGRQCVLLRNRRLQARLWSMVAAQQDRQEPTSKNRFQKAPSNTPSACSPNAKTKGQLHLEARIAMIPTLGVSSPDWHAPRIGDTYGLEIVHTDPDGGDYGGHFLDLRSRRR